MYESLWIATNAGLTREIMFYCDLNPDLKDSYKQQITGNTAGNMLKQHLLFAQALCSETLPNVRV